MSDKFLFGLCLGMIGGAVIVANSVKARQAVKSGQEQVIEKVSELGKKQKQPEKQG